MDNFAQEDPRYPTLLKNYFTAAAEETGSLTIEAALGAVEEWLTEHAAYRHPMFASAHSVRGSALLWLVSDEFASAGEDIRG